MIGNYGGYYMMHEVKLTAYKRLAEAALSAGHTPDFMMQADIARQNRLARIRPTESDSYISYSDYIQYAKALGSPATPVFSIDGSLSREGNCNMGYEELSQIVIHTANDPITRKIGFKVNSPGGGVDGVKGLADAVSYARSKGIRVESWGGYIASAAVYSISPSDFIWLDDQAASEIGSIGVLFVHFDESKALENAGIKVTIHRAPGSENKARLNSIEPVTPEILAPEIAFLKDLRKEFIGYVRRGRRGKLTSTEWEDASMFRTKDALRIGLADGVSSLNNFLDQLKQI
jgi:ClpP class serine protease